MHNLPSEDLRAVAVREAIRTGNVEALERELRENPGLAKARIVDRHGVARTLLHLVADWPGHFPNGARMIATLAAVGADVDAAVEPHGPKGSKETPLHWAASSDDVEVIDALLDAGADIEAPGAVFTGGTPMSDAVVFAQWNAARRLLERGATTTFWQAAALGLLDRVKELGGVDLPERDLTNAFWHACRGGRKEVAEHLISRGADASWIGYDGKTPLDVAEEGGCEEVVAWLRRIGAKRAAEAR